MMTQDDFKLLVALLVDGEMTDPDHPLWTDPWMLNHISTLLISIASQFKQPKREDIGRFVCNANILMRMAGRDRVFVDGSPRPVNYSFTISIISHILNKNHERYIKASMSDEVS